MRKIQVTVTVDTSNVEQMQAFSELLDVLSRTEDNVGTVAAVPEPKKEEKKVEPSKPAATGEKITDEDLRKIVKEKSADTALRPKVRTVLDKYKAKNVSEIKAEDYAAAKKDLEAIK